MAVVSQCSKYRLSLITGRPISMYDHVWLSNSTILVNLSSVLSVSIGLTAVTESLAASDLNVAPVGCWADNEAVTSRPAANNIIFFIVQMYKLFRYSPM